MASPSPDINKTDSCKSEISDKEREKNFGRFDFEIDENDDKKVKRRLEVQKHLRVYDRLICFKCEASLGDKNVPLRDVAHQQIDAQVKQHLVKVHGIRIDGHLKVKIMGHERSWPSAVADVVEMATGQKIDETDVPACKGVFDAEVKERVKRFKLPELSENYNALQVIEQMSTIWDLFYSSDSHVTDVDGDDYEEECTSEVLEQKGQLIDFVNERYYSKLSVPLFRTPDGISLTYDDLINTCPTLCVIGGINATLMQLSVAALRTQVPEGSGIFVTDALSWKPDQAVNLDMCLASLRIDPFSGGPVGSLCDWARFLGYNATVLMPINRGDHQQAAVLSKCAGKETVALLCYDSNFDFKEADKRSLADAVAQQLTKRRIASPERARSIVVASTVPRGGSFKIQVLQMCGSYAFYFLWTKISGEQMAADHVEIVYKMSQLWLGYIKKCLRDQQR